MKISTKLLLVVIGIILFLSGSLVIRSKFIKPPRISSSFGDIQFSAPQKNSSGVDPKSSVILASSQTLDPASVSQTIKITPEIEYSVKKINDNSVEINFSKDLEKSTIYQINLDKSAWAFQVESPFNIDGSLPRHKSTSVNLNTSIEFYFNNPSFSASAEKYFDIQPPTAGRFEKHQNSLVFIPSSLVPNTLYTVTIKQGFSLTDNSQKLAKDYLIQFETGNSDKTPVRRFDFQKPIFESSPDQPPIAIISNWDPPSQKVKAKIYQFNSSDFKNCLAQKISIPSWSRQSRFHRCQTVGPSISELELDVKSASQYGSKYLELPSKLDVGYYALEVSNSDSSLSQTLLEVSPVSWYYWVGQEDSLFWINDMITKKPASNVKLVIGSKEIGTIGNEGTLNIATPEELKSRQNQILTIQTPTFTAYSLVDYQNNGQYITTSATEIQKNNFWAYVYTDREIYLPTDKINFWGIVKSRSSSSSEKITVEINRGYYSYWDEDNSPQDGSLKKMELNTSSHGTFQGNFDFSDFSPGYYNLIIKNNGNFVSQKSFSVETFKKPAYRITAKPQKLVLWAGQSNKIDLSVKFFDGTPVSSTQLSWTVWDGHDDKKGEITTDKSGNATLDIPTSYDSTRNYWPQNVSVNIHPKGMQDGEISAYTSFFTFGPEYNLTVDSTSSKDQMRITVVVRKNDLTLLEKSPWKNQGDFVANQPVSIKVDRVWHDKVEEGEYYDPVNKITSKKYRYDRKTEEVSNQTLNTNDQGKIDFSQSIITDQQYEVSIATDDSQNRTAKSTIFISGNNYSLEDQFSAKTSKSEYSINDPIEISLNYNGDLVPESEPNKYLLFFVRNGRIYKTTTSDKNKYSFSFVNDYIPNIILKSVWFNGSTYMVDNNWRGYSKNGLDLLFDTTSKELKIEAKTSQAKYQPGDEASIEISVKNNSGQPQPNVKLLLSVIDESLSDIGGVSSPDILSRLYASVGEGGLINYASNQLPKSGGGAEGGGGGGENRTIFKNTAVFQELFTDATGMVRYKFKLPDNITSWRATAIAVGSDLSAGDSQLLIPVTKPIFIDVITNDEFVVTDKPKISAIAYGDGLDTNSQVNYSLSAPSLGININNVSQQAFKPVYFDLNKISLGEHKLEIKASSGSFKDGLVKNINVVNSRNLLPRQEIISLDKEYKPGFTSQRPVYFTFIDKGLSSLYSKLKHLTNINYYGLQERSDRLAAENISSRLLMEYFSEQATETESDFNRYINENGVSLMSNSDADLVLTAKFAAANIPLVDKSQLIQALTKSYRKETSIEKVSATLWGLSELGQPLLNTVDILSKEKNTPRGQIYLGLAFAAQGDKFSAGKIFDEIISKYGVRQDPFLFVKTNSNEQDTVEDTALTMILSAKIGSIENQEKLWSYLNIAKSEDQIYVLEKAITLQSSIVSYPFSPSEFEYSLAGKKYVQKITGDNAFTQTVSQSDLESFSVKPLSGSVSLVARWWENFDPTKISTNPNISLDVVTNPVDKLSDSDYMSFIITPKISKNTTNESYLVAVNLPSGLRLIDNPSSFKTLTGKNEFYSQPSFRENNRLIFWSSFNYPIRFLARPVNKGQFSFEPSIIYSSDTINQINVSSPHPDLTID